VQGKRGEEVNPMFHSLSVIFAKAKEDPKRRVRVEDRGKRRDEQRTGISRRICLEEEGHQNHILVLSPSLVARAAAAVLATVHLPGTAALVKIVR